MGRHIALGIAQLHSNGIIHRDIKSMNVLVTNDYGAKLTDFGTSKLLSNESMKAKDETQSRIAGTPKWMAPEVANYSFTYGYPADVYSLGIVLYEILELAMPPYSPQHKTHLFPDTFKSSFLIRPCVEFEANKRIFSQQVVQKLDEYLRKLLITVAQSLDRADENALLDLSDNLKLNRDTENVKNGVKLTDEEEEEEKTGDLVQGIYLLMLNKSPQVVDDILTTALNSKK
jgi:p21-activated kinase 1